MFYHRDSFCICHSRHLVLPYSLNHPPCYLNFNLPYGTLSVLILHIASRPTCLLCPELSKPRHRPSSYWGANPDYTISLDNSSLLSSVLFFFPNIFIKFFFGISKSSLEVFHKILFSFPNIIPFFPNTLRYIYIQQLFLPIFPMLFPTWFPLLPNQLPNNLHRLIPNYHSCHLPRLLRHLSKDMVAQRLACPRQRVSGSNPDCDRLIKLVINNPVSESAQKRKYND